MAERPLRLGLSLATCFVLAAACGGGGPGSGFGGGGNGGSGGSGADATVDGSGHHGGGGDDSGISLLGDSGGGGGNDAPPPCTGIACQVKNCGSGGDTTVSGIVYAPNGTLPLYDVQVFIPNTPLAPFTQGVQCDQCGAQVSGSPITTALSDPTGHFTLKGVPSGANIPIVVQLGKWRRETMIPMVTACTANTLTDATLTRLPKNQTEGSMPHIALTTGGCDNLGCMLPKVGIDPIEFGYQSDGYNKAINIYNGSGGGSGLTAATAADSLWSSMSTLMTYDMSIFSCECQEALFSKGGAVTAPEFGVVTDYLNAGGRIFTTDFQYTWYKYSPDPAMGGTPVGSATTGLGDIIGGAGPGGNPISLVTTFPKGLALSQWMKTVFPTDTYASMGEVAPDYVFGNFDSLTSSALTWAGSGTTSSYGTPGDPSPGTGPAVPRVFTVDTPAGAATAKQCGRGVHIDAHVDNPGTSTDTVGCGSTGCYPASCPNPLKPDEAMFAFFFFDLASCIQNEMMPPMPPPVPPPPK
jgi:hypothetical protein